MPTPKDDPSILEQWKTLFQQYQQEGVLKYPAYGRIAKQFDVYPSTVAYWLDPERREKEKVRRIKYLRDPQKRERQRQLTKERYYRVEVGHKDYQELLAIITNILETIFEEEEPLSLEDICRRLEELHTTKKGRRMLKPLLSYIPIKEVRKGIYVLKR